MRSMIIGALLGVVVVALPAGAQFKPIESGHSSAPPASFGPTVVVPSAGPAVGGAGAGGSPPLDTRPLPVPQGADGCPPGKQRIDGVCQ
jgi:hypothetical protein